MTTPAPYTRAFFSACGKRAKHRGHPLTREQAQAMVACRRDRKGKEKLKGKKATQADLDKGKGSVAIQSTPA